MSQMFNSIKVGTSARSTFDLSHHQVTTSDFGYLIPICYRDMLPNDEFVVKPEVFCRLAPLASPTYGRIKCRIHHFFVPYRILYPKWSAFITQDASNHTVPPYFTEAILSSVFSNDPAISSDTLNPVDRGLYQKLASNLGLNPSLIVNSEHNLNSDRFAAFPFLAYYRIWLDYFMDSNIYSHSSLVESFNQSIVNGGALTQQFAEEILKVRSCCYKKDYFTTAKLSPQSGSPASGSVSIASPSDNSGLSGTGTVLRTSTNGQQVYRGTTSSSAPANANSIIGKFTAEAMRFASALQRYSERSNYVGSKLINQLLVHFGVAPTPERLDMSEFIGGDSFNIQIGDVTSTNSHITSDGLDTRGLGTQAGKGIGGSSSKEFTYHAKEHGVWLSLMSILPDTGYYQGVSRFWFKGVHGDALDYYTPEFENLGFQEVLNKEVYVPFTPSLDYQDYDPDGIFGYQPRFSEYKFQQDILGSDFVSLDTNSGVSGAAMSSFHLFRELDYDDTYPLALNENFVECKNLYNSYDRIFQITDNSLDHFYFNIDVDVKATRDMVGFAEPSLDSVNNLGDGNKIDIPYGGTRL